MKEGIIQLQNYLRSFGIFTGAEIEVMDSMVTWETIRKEDHFIQEGQVCNRVAFLYSGILRSYYLTAKGDEVTYCFLFPEQFITAYSSFITSRPSPESIIAITDVKLLVLSRQVVEENTARSINWVRFQKLIAERLYVEMEERIFKLLKEKAETRYESLLTEHPELVRSIPLQYIASYLGITQRHLSRLRRGLAN